MTAQPGFDPSDNRDMGTVFARIQRIATLTDAATLTLDHVPKGALVTGPAAHSGLRITSYNVCYTKLLRFEAGESWSAAGGVYMRAGLKDRAAAAYERGGELETRNNFV